MPYEYAQDDHPPRGHVRGRSTGTGKGSNDSGKSRGTKPISQKAMLSRALQKANTAVQLDNAQNFEGARHAYAEACDLLQHVLQRTSADEDKRKLEAIVSPSTPDAKSIVSTKSNYFSSAEHIRVASMSLIRWVPGRVPAPKPCLLVRTARTTAEDQF